MSIKDCEIIKLPKLNDVRGNLTFVESNVHIPFSIERVYYLYDVPGGAARGGHAHKNLKQVIVALSGSFDVLIDDGSEKKVVTLNRGNEGLVIGNHIWRELFNFSSGSVCLVFASEKYSEEDYIRDYTQFIKEYGKKN